MRFQAMMFDRAKQDGAAVTMVKGRIVVLLASTTFFWAALPPLPVFAQALPSGGAVTSGAASISTGGTSVLVTQTSPTAIVNWNSFSIGQGNAVRFENGAGATLNRVTGFSHSQIDGALSATGSVYLVNPSGITVGPSGSVSTGGSFIASTHDVSDSAFHAGGALTFKGGSKASVINYGSIGSLGGDVALIARKVENAGTITAPNGTVALAAGYEVLMRDAALSDGKFVVKVGGADTEARTSGVIKAAEVELRANGGNVYALAGNTGSVTKATGVASKGGRVFLTAGDGGRVDVSQRVVARAAPVGGKARGGEVRVAGGAAKISGQIDARGENAAGGTVVVTARDITLTSDAALDASGTTGGTVLVGGDFQGGTGAVRYLAETLATAESVTVAGGASIRVDGSAGAGGKVVVWSDGRTSFAGTISARGAGSAAGGDAEVSGKVWLDYRGTADLRSDSGAFGTLLLDPYNLTIAASASSGMNGFSPSANDSVLDVATLTAALATANVELTTGSGGTQAGNITVAAPIIWSANSILTMRTRAKMIAINADITALGAGGGVVLGGLENYSTDYSFGNGARLSLPTVGSTLVINNSGYVLIRSMSELDAIDSTGLSGSYALAVDLDAGGTIYGDGLVTHRFYGTFAGLGHTISNLTISAPGSRFTGLFNDLGGGGVLRDIGLVGGSVSGGSDVGGLVGFANGGTIHNSYNTGTVTGNVNVGGLVGELDGSITNSYATGAVSGISFVGGLVGYASGPISDSYATGNVTGTDTAAGGLAGFFDNEYTYRNVYATGDVTGFFLVGGLSGYLSEDATITNAFATGAVNGRLTVGGLVGQNDNGTISNAYATGAVTGGSEVGGLVASNLGAIVNSYATGAVTGVSSAGGLVGDNHGSIIASFWDTETTGLAVSAGGGTGLTTAQMRDLSTFTAAGWDIDGAGGTGKVWRIYDGQTGPLLRSYLKPLTVTANDVTKTYDGGAFSGENVTYAGFVNGDTAASLSGTLTYGAAQGATNAGSYVITPQGLYSGQQGYDIAYRSGSLTVNQRALTITANGQSGAYGDAVPALTYTVGGLGLVNGDSLTGSLATSATSVSGVGDYVITQGTLAGNANYAITYTGANFTVTPRTIVVTADPARAVAGSAIPALGYRLGGMGLANGDTLSGALATDATASSPAGRYRILQGTLAASANYALTYIGGFLTLTPTDSPNSVSTLVPPLFETTAPAPFVDAPSTRNAMSLLYGPTRPAMTPEAPCDRGRSCRLIPVASNLPTSPWLSFGGW